MSKERLNHSFVQVVLPPLWARAVRSARPHMHKNSLIHGSFLLDAVVTSKAKEERKPNEARKTSANLIYRLMPFYSLSLVRLYIVGGFCFCLQGFGTSDERGAATLMGDSAATVQPAA